MPSNNEMAQNRIWSEDPRANAKHKVRELPNVYFFQVKVCFSHLADWAPNQRFGFLKNHPTDASPGITPRCQLPGMPQGITCHCPKAPRTTSAVIVPRHHMILPLGITCHCTNVSHVAPRHHMSFSKLKALHAIAPGHRLQLPQSITCWCITYRFSSAKSNELTHQQGMFCFTHAPAFYTSSNIMKNVVE